MMNASNLKSFIKRSKNKIERNNSRVIIRAHIPWPTSRISKIISRVISLSERQAEELLETVIDNFYRRHKNIEQQLSKHFVKVKEYLPGNT